MLSEQQQRIMGYFIEEAKDHLNTIEQGLLNLQATIEDSEMVNEVFRAAHSVKGGAAMLGLNSIQLTAHRLEDYFKVLKECPLRVDQRLETLFLRVFDTLQELLEQLQGPFGLTDEKAAEVMSEVEPTFQALNQHLGALVSQSGGQPPEDVDLAMPVPVEVAVPKPKAEPPKVAIANQEESALRLIFQSDVPARLREMLQLFKQSDTSSSRRQLQDVCRTLALAGEQLELTAWCGLLEVAQQAIANPDNTYRTLAPIIIKEIKQAQELVLAGRSTDIQCSESLRALLPTLVEISSTDDDLATLLANAGLEEVAAEPFDIGTPEEQSIPLMGISDSPFADEEPAVTDTWFDDVAAPESSFEDIFALEDRPQNDDVSASQSSSGDSFEQTDNIPTHSQHNGPEVGIAELNSLADLFEGEVPELGMTWQEEEIISDIPSNFSESPDTDHYNDFSDLLFEQDESEELDLDIDLDEDDLSGLLNSTEPSNYADAEAPFTLSESSIPELSDDSSFSDEFASMFTQDSEPSGEEASSPPQLGDLVPESTDRFENLDELFSGLDNDVPLSADADSDSDVESLDWEAPVDVSVSNELGAPWEDFSAESDRVSESGGLFELEFSELDIQEEPIEEAFDSGDRIDTAISDSYEDIGSESPINNDGLLDALFQDSETEEIPGWSENSTASLGELIDQPDEDLVQSTYLQDASWDDQELSVDLWNDAGDAASEATDIPLTAFDPDADDSELEPFDLSSASSPIFEDNEFNLTSEDENSLESSFELFDEAVADPADSDHAIQEVNGDIDSVPDESFFSEPSSLFEESIAEEPIASSTESELEGQPSFDLDELFVEPSANLENLGDAESENTDPVDNFLIVEDTTASESEASIFDEEPQFGSAGLDIDDLFSEGSSTGSSEGDLAIDSIFDSSTEISDTESAEIEINNLFGANSDFESATDLFFEESINESEIDDLFEDEVASLFSTESSDFTEEVDIDSMDATQSDRSTSPENIDSESVDLEFGSTDSEDPFEEASDSFELASDSTDSTLDVATDNVAIDNVAIDFDGSVFDLLDTSTTDQSEEPDSLEGFDISFLEFDSPTDDASIDANTPLSEIESLDLEGIETGEESAALNVFDLNDLPLDLQDEPSEGDVVEAIDFDSELNLAEDDSVNLADDQNLTELNALLGEEFPQSDDSDVTASESEQDFSELDALLGDELGTSATDVSISADSPLDDFAGLEALIEDSAAPSIPGLSLTDSISTDSPDEFDDLEKLLESADETLGGSPSSRSARGPSNVSNRRVNRRGGVLNDQTMRVSVKHLDNLNNLVGELVVNRNSLEQAEERLRQFLDNLLYQVQQLSDVGQRMRDLYERSLLESSLLSSRKPYQLSTQGGIASQAEANHATGVNFDALEMDRFTGFHTLSQEMIELIVRVRESASDIDFVVDETDQITRTFRQITTQLQEGLTRSRMVPFAQTADRLPRAVRDISLQNGKQAELVVEGRETLIDKMILEQLYDPMTHLVNNAIAHGIETPEQRIAARKPPMGRITVRTFHQGNQTVISVTDDGAGIDPEKVKAKAIEKRLITAAEAREMSRLDVYDLLFHHGFSTKDKADNISGRGVGMDVVRTSLNEIRGVINIDSTIGKGTTFTIRLPLTLSISKALCCISNRARIAFPMDGVEDMLDVPKERVQTDDQGRPCIQWRDSLLPFQPLSDLLKYNRTLGRGSVYGGNQEDDIISIVVLRSNAGNYLALQIDQVLGEQEIVIKQLEGPVPKPVGVAGATVLGDGRIMPIADVLELIDLSLGRIRREAGSSLWEKDDDQIPVEPAAVKTEPTVLIVDDSITVRELLSMTFNKVGYRVEQARDGQEAWEKLRSGLPCDLVFCDIEMPRMDGLELLSRIQKDPNLSHMPIAMLTSRGADRHRQMAIQLGAKGYFTKPYLEEALLDAAQRMLKGEVLVG